jgi:hypothetical protein
LESVNRLRIGDVTYQFRFGPVLYRDCASEAELAELVARARAHLSQKSGDHKGGSSEC